MNSKTTISVANLEVLSKMLIPAINHDFFQEFSLTYMAMYKLQRSVQLV